MGALAAFVFVLPLPPVIERVSVSAPAMHVYAAAASADLDAERLRIAGCCSSDWVRFARQAAGADAMPAIVSVDGLATGMLPPAAAISRIQVNRDPFSAEFSEPDAAHVEITTRSPARAFNWSAGVDALGAGGRNPLAAEESDGRGYSALASGGVPGTPLAFLASGVFSRESTPLPILAGGADSAIQTSRAARISAVLFFSSAAADWRARYAQWHSRDRNAGAGGITTEEAAFDAAGAHRELQLTGTQRTNRYHLRVGASLTASARTSDGQTDAPAIEVPGIAADSAPVFASDATRRRSAALRMVADLQSPRAVQIGLFTRVDRHAVRHDPNPNGLLVFHDREAFDAARAHGARTGTLFLAEGRGAVDWQTVDASAFAQGLLVNGPAGSARAGLRVDYQSHDRVRVSPRLSWRRQVRGVSIAGGAGMFVYNTAPEVFGRVALGAPTALRERIVAEAGLDWPADAAGKDQGHVTRSVDTGYRRRSDVVARSSIAGSIGGLHTQLEYTFTRGRHAAGLVRWPTASGWEDRLTTAFGLRRHQLHVRARWSARQQSITAHVQAIHARDQSSGSFHPQSASSPDAGAWAPSAGIPPVRASVVGSFVLPSQILLSIVATSAAGSRYDIVSPAFARDYSRTNRAGLTRNSGTGAPIHHVEMSAMKTVRLAGREMTAGIRIENLLNRTNVTALGAVAGTPLFNRPVEAAPLRSVRVWIGF